MGIRVVIGFCAFVCGVWSVRWYDRSPWARGLVFWVFTADVRRQNPEIYGRRRG